MHQFSKPEEAERYSQEHQADASAAVNEADEVAELMRQADELIAQHNAEMMKRLGL
jgi:hypothetical protein